VEKPYMDKHSCYELPPCSVKNVIINLSQQSENIGAYPDEVPAKNYLKKIHNNIQSHQS